MFNAVCYIIPLTGDCLESTIKDVAKAIAETTPRKRPNFLPFPYIIHTLSIRTTVSICSGDYPWIIWLNIHSTHAKLIYP